MENFDFNISVWRHRYSLDNNVQKDIYACSYSHMIDPQHVLAEVNKLSQQIL